MQTSQHGSNSPNHRPPAPSPLKPPPLAPDADFNIPSIALSPIPSDLEMLRYEEQLRRLSANTPPAAFAELVRCSLSLRDRLLGSSTSGDGGLKATELRVEWARHAERALSDLARICPDLYRNAPLRVIATGFSDFVERLTRRGVLFSKPHTQSLISECLEQSRLMVIFAGGALKSDEHVQSALSGLKGKSYAGGASERPEKGGPLDAASRQNSFEARQQAKRQASEERKAALQAGAALPVRGAKPPPPKDELKTELLTQTAGDYSKLCRDSQPSAAQKESLAQLSARELEVRLAGRLTKPKGGGRNEELEALRIEITNEVARTLRSWLDNEIHLAVSLKQDTLKDSNCPLDPQSAAERATKLGTHRSRLESFSGLVKEKLLDLGRITKTPGAGTLLAAALTPEERKRLDEILNPPEEKPTYDLA